MTPPRTGGSSFTPVPTTPSARGAAGATRAVNRRAIQFASMADDESDEPRGEDDDRNQYGGDESDIDPVEQTERVEEDQAEDDERDGS